MPSRFREKIGELKEVSDLFYLAMLDADPSSLVGELASLVGHENMLKLLDIFHDSTIKFPSKEKIRTAVRNAAIWAEYQKGVPTNDLMDRYALRRTELTRILDRWDELKKAEKVAGLC